MWAINGFVDDPKGGQGYEEIPRFDRRPGPLPGIPFSDSPIPTGDNQIMPYGGRKSQLSLGPPVSDYSDGKLKVLEQRLGIAEQSNRALLEEVVRLQGEMKQQQRRVEETLGGERQARIHLQENLRASNDLVGQLGVRLKRAEEKVQDERSAVGALVNHTKQVEQAVLGSQQELMSRRDTQFSKIAELRNELDEANRMREQVERATNTIVDEMRQIRSKVDTQQVEHTGLLHDLKERSKRLEEEYRSSKMEQQRKFGESQNSSDQSTAMLRSQLDARLSEVRDVLLDLRNRLTSEETERRQSENQTYMRLNEMQAQVLEQSRKRDESMHALDVVQREREHAADNERLKMQGKIAEIAEEVSKKILHKEIRLREEAQQKFANIEKYLHAEQAARIAHEQAMREENEKRWGALQKLTEDEVVGVREGQKMDRHKNFDGLHKINDAIEMLEKQQGESKKQLENVMKAEIKSRQTQDKQIEDRIEDVQEKLGVAISTLQQAIGGVNEQVSALTSDAELKLRGIIEEQNHSHLRGVADLDSRIIAINSRVNQQEEEFAEKLQDTLVKIQSDTSTESIQRVTEVQREQIEDIHEWRDSTQNLIKDLKERLDDVAPEVAQMSRLSEKAQDGMKTMVDTEIKDRTRDVQMVRVDLQTKYQQLKTEIQQAMEEAKKAVPAGGAAAAAAAVSVVPTQKDRLAEIKKGKGGGKVDEETVERIGNLEDDVNKLNNRYREIMEEIADAKGSVETVKAHLNKKMLNESKETRGLLTKLTEDINEMKIAVSKSTGGPPPHITPPPPPVKENTALSLLSKKSSISAKKTPTPPPQKEKSLSPVVQAEEPPPTEPPPTEPPPTEPPPTEPPEPVSREETATSKVSEGSEGEGGAAGGDKKKKKKKSRASKAESEGEDDAAAAGKKKKKSRASKAESKAGSDEGGN